MSALLVLLLAISVAWAVYVSLTPDVRDDERRFD